MCPWIWQNYLLSLVSPVFAHCWSISCYTCSVVILVFDKGHHVKQHWHGAGLDYFHFLVSCGFQFLYSFLSLCSNSMNVGGFWFMCLNDSPQIYQQVFTAILSVKLVVGLPFLLVSQLRFNWLIIDSDIIASSPCHNCPIGQCQSTNKVANGSRMQCFLYG